MEGVTVDVVSLDQLVDPSKAAHCCCSICNSIFTSPVQCLKGHVFCDACVKQKLQVKETCPDVDDVEHALTIAELRTSRFAANLVGKLQVRCPHAAQHTNGAEDCGWVGMVSERAQHIGTECAYRAVACPQCGTSVALSQMALHQLRCTPRPVAGLRPGPMPDIPSRPEIPMPDFVVSPDQLVDRSHAAHCICSICKNILTSPVECQCPDEGHVFCEGCANQKLRVQETCPEGGHALTSAELGTSRFAANLVGKLQVRCPHAAQHTNGAEDCGWVGTVNALKVHVRDAHVRVACEFGCPDLLLPQDLAAHWEEAAVEHAAMALRTLTLQAQAIEDFVRKITALEDTHRRSAARCTLPVIVKWVIEDGKAKFPSAPGEIELAGKRAVVQSPDGCRQPINLKLKAVFGEDYLGLYIRNDGSDSGYNGRVCLDGATITLCDSRQTNKDIVKKFEERDCPKANTSVGFTRVASRADVQRWYLAADGSITVLASLCARCTEEVMCV